MRHLLRRRLIRIVDRVAPEQPRKWSAQLDGEPYRGRLEWSASINAPSAWKGAPFEGVLTVGYDQWRLLLGRWRIRRQFSPVVVFFDGLDPLERLLRSPVKR